MASRAATHSSRPDPPMFDTLCALPLSAHLFAQAVHPTEPLLAVGLATGHVSTLRLPAVNDDNVPDQEPSKSSLRSRRRGSDGTGVIDTAWRTKRHKDSCRSLCYSLDGLQLYSAGSDGIVKAADSATGQVTGKVAIPFDPTAPHQEIDKPTLMHALSPQTLLLATESGALHLYDLRDPAPSVPAEDLKLAFVNAKPAQTQHPHSDLITSLSPIPASSTSTSGYSKQWLTTGGMTLALTDLRRGVLVKSEDQDELLLSSLYVTGLAAKKSSGSTGEKAVVGGGDGVLTLWEKGQWDDQDERIVVSRDKETLDSLALIPDGIGGFGKKVAVGMGNGRVSFVQLGVNKVIGEVMHDEIEEVTDLDFDVGGRMISGGGHIVKVWCESMAAADDDEEEDEVQLKRPADSDDSDEDDDDSDDEAASSKKPRKKRKRGKGPAKTSNFSFAGLD